MAVLAFVNLETVPAGVGVNILQNCVWKVAAVAVAEISWGN